MNTPLVSIIIPTYNRAYLIGETLDSVLAQTYKNWECIVVDDGSTDYTEELLEFYTQKDFRIKYHHRPKNRKKGANACRNYGFELSKGEYIQLLDSDDIIETYSLLERVQCISRNDSVDLVIRDTGLLIDTEKQYVSINLDPDNISREAYLGMFLRYDIPWQTMAAFYKRKLLNICKFDENLGRFQDVSFNIKILSTFRELSILRDIKIDTFYRVEKDKKITKEFLRRIIESLENFNEIHYNLARKVSYRNDLRMFNIKFFNDYFLKSIDEHKKEIGGLVFSYVKGNIFSFKQKCYITVCFIFYSTGLIHQKRIGMLRFNKAYQKILEFK